MEQLVTFVLTEKHPTTYQKPDGSFFDTPVRKRIIPEYSLMNEDGSVTMCRHIRNENSIEVSKQTTVFNRKVDNIYFSYGVCVLDSKKDKVTIEFLRKHPMNADQEEYTRRTDVYPSFREVKQELEGLTEIDRIILTQKATNQAIALKLEDGTYSPRLKFYAKVFKLDGSLADSEKVVALVGKANENPVDFMHQVNAKWETMEKDLESALRFDVVAFDNKTAFLKKEPLFSTENELNEEDMKNEIMSFLLSNEGEDKYKEMQGYVAAESKKVSEKVLKPTKAKGETKVEPETKTEAQTEKNELEFKK